MTIFIFTLAIAGTSILAGFLGALTGLGGGVVIIPTLVLLFHVDIRYAIGASLISVIATSSGAASAYVKEGFTNLRMGMFLEIATTAGALAGAFLAAKVAPNFIAIIFGGILMYSAFASSHQAKKAVVLQPPDPLGTLLKLNGSYPEGKEEKSYSVYSVPAGFSLMFIAGTISGLLGIGSGAVKVLAMDQAMRVPFKVSSTTSNFMIGVTAAASAGVYLNRGYIDPGLAMPVMLGVLLGAVLGSHVLANAKTALLRKIFGFVLFALAIEMIYSGITGRL